jgi:hypothetical protein
MARSRLDVLERGVRKSANDLARQRQVIEDLCLDGRDTRDAEAVLRRFEAVHGVLLTKLAALRGESENAH